MINKCSLKYMFDDGEKAMEEDSIMAEQDDESIISSHNKFLDDYF